ncbi:protein enabled homolog isoform X1 [Anopheles bellator]|uniref:protein enabled homolog isoform X1 n=1 Tax=Anopheles bellator TaxID=139047 RepID=UPI002648ECF6|nr:protein enabled homolog isoform X1 [Anopheles bellator]
MATSTPLIVLVVGVLLCILGQSRASPLSGEPTGVAQVPQIPNMPGPGDFPRPPNMAQSRVVRQAPPDFPDQGKMPPPPEGPPPMPSMRARRDTETPSGQANDLPTFAQTTSHGRREKRAAKGTGGKFPSKTG